MKAIERIYKYLDYKGVKPARFEKETGISNGYLGTQLRRKGNLGEDILNKILDNCLDLSAEWLLTGSGEMLRTGEKAQAQVPEKIIETKDPRDQRIIELQEKQIMHLEEKVSVMEKDINAFKSRITELEERERDHIERSMERHAKK